MEFEIKKASEEDYEEIAALIASVWQQLEEKDWFVADNADYTYHMLKKGNGIGFKAVEKASRRLAGVFLITFPGTSEENLGRDIGMEEEKLCRVAHMDSVAVLPEYRGNGLQLRLMQRGEEELRRLGYSYLMCTVHPDNIYSKENVIRQGYQAAAKKEKYGGYVREIFLKTLPLFKSRGMSF